MKGAGFGEAELRGDLSDAAFAMAQHFDRKIAADLIL